MYTCITIITCILNELFLYIVFIYMCYTLGIVMFMVLNFMQRTVGSMLGGVKQMYIQLTLLLLCYTNTIEKSSLNVNSCLR